MSYRTLLLDLLTHFLRIISLAQLVGLMAQCRHARQTARQSAERLSRGGLVQSCTAMVHPPLTPSEPLHEHHPGKDAPDFHKLAYFNQTRWNLVPIRTTVLCATRKAAELTGGPLPTRGALRDSDLSHDLTLASIFLTHYFAYAGTTWIPEDALVAEGWPRSDTNIPDAVVRTVHDETIVELVGRSYSARRLREIHRAFSNRRYVLW